MEFVIEVFWALLMVGTPIAVFTLVLVWWALQRGHLQEGLDTKALGREMKAMSKSHKKKNKEGQASQHGPDQPLDQFLVSSSPVQRKWVKFGGGFYGIVAFFTYIVVEVTDVTTTILSFGGFTDFLRQLDFNLIIGIFIEALTNFITAMIWPVYWMERIETDQTWIWFLVAYGGYWLGLKQAQAMFQRRKDAET